MKLLVTFLCAAMLSLPAAAQYPNKPVRLIVPFPPGGAAELGARIFTQPLSQQLGHPILIETRPGAEGIIASEAVKKSDADGYTLYYGTATGMSFAPAAKKVAPYDPVNDFTPISMVGIFGFFVFSHASLPVNNINELIAYARANPGKLSYGTPGNGTSPHIAGEVYSREAGVKLNHIPYKGAGPALKDLLGGVTDSVFDPGVGLPQVKAGKLRLIAIAGPQRHPDFPDVPTLEENGIKGVDGGPYFGFYAPNGTPRAIVDRLNAEVQKVMQEPAVRERFRVLAVNLAPPMNPDQFAAYVRAEYDRYAKLLKELGIDK
jgi:tripartite-type tricarboxylate transporter receptor subunit TctC